MTGVQVGRSIEDLGLSQVPYPDTGLRTKRSDRVKGLLRTREGSRDLIVKLDWTV